jgi:hypothetical protein|tara:strand:+ start:233 stop:487 length:255 start_codon:yes stop_codon:yes gene_type:complete
MGKGIRMIHRDCDPSLAENKNLPYTSFLIEYLQDGMTKFDIASGNKQVDIFDHYWDNYRHDLINMTQTEGRINPKMWNPPSEKK